MLIPVPLPLIGAVFTVLRCTRHPSAVGPTAANVGLDCSCAMCIPRRPIACKCSLIGRPTHVYATDRASIFHPWCSFCLKAFGLSEKLHRMPGTCCPHAQSSAVAALACSITAGACCVGMRTSVCGNGGSSSAFFSESSSSFGCGSFAAVI